MKRKVLLLFLALISFALLASCSSSDLPLAIDLDAWIGSNTTPTEGIFYDVSADGTYAEVISYSGKDRRVVITDTYMGLPVRSIYAEAFAKTDVMSVSIPNSVTVIGKSAFDNCKNLRTIVWSEHLAVIEDKAFNNCNNLTSLKLPDSVICLGYGSFGDCDGLVSVDLGNGLQQLGERAFVSCTGLVNLKIPGSVGKIGNYAFLDCRKLEHVEMGEGIASIGVGAFEICNLKEISLPSTIMEIGEAAFRHGGKFESVSIPDSVEVIGDEAFATCSIKSLRLGSGLRYIGQEAFFVSGMTRVIFSNLQGWTLSDGTILTENELSDPYRAAGCFKREQYGTLSWTRTE